MRMNGGEPEPLPLLTSPSAAMAIQAIERTLAKVGDQSSQDGVPVSVKNYYIFIYYAIRI